MTKKTVLTAAPFKLEEASISQLQEALRDGIITSVDLTVMFLNRIFHYDHRGIQLNSIPIIYKEALEQAAQMDVLRSEGTLLGPLHGIPFTVKDSYMVKGLTVAAGSPSFVNLIAPRHSFIVEKIIESGGILIGKTNMPPMAAGGMQKGVYGRAESPYNKDYLTAAWASGSSNGSGTATAANFSVFGMAEETVSSGRSPASNNGLVAYTPSRGIISIRGNWPLFPTKDVVVPHTKYMEDLFSLLDVIVQEDTDHSGDFWRMQKAVALPGPMDIRPKSYHDLQNPSSLQHVRLGVPKMFLGLSQENPLYMRPSILKLWKDAVRQLEACGAEIIEIDFPLQALYSSSPTQLKPFEEKGYLPKGWMETERTKLNPMFAELFLKSCESDDYPSWASLDSTFTFPNPAESVDEKRNANRLYDHITHYVQGGLPSLSEVPGLVDGLKGLEEIRKQEFECWLQKEQLDGLVFPANSNIGKANSDMVEASYDTSLEQGNYFSNGNEMLRHLGIPTVSVTMGVMEDTDVPVNLTFCGPAYSDNALLSWAYAYEHATMHRTPPKRTPAIESTAACLGIANPAKQSLLPLPRFGSSLKGNQLSIQSVDGHCPAGTTIKVFINGKTAAVSTDADWSVQVDIAPFLDMDAFQKNYLDVIVLYQAESQLSNAVHEKIYFPFLD
ncbi:MAG: amidase [Lysinibacillus sp.]